MLMCFVDLRFSYHQHFAQQKTNADYKLSATLKYFYFSRFKRIAPAYFVMLVLVALVATIFFLPKGFATFKASLETATWFNSNYYFAEFGHYFAPANHEQPLLRTWSLAVEMQFYLVAPFLVLLLSGKALKAVFGAPLLGLTLVAEYRLRIRGIEQATYYSLYARLAEFFAGSLAAMYVTSVSGRGSSWHTNFGILLIILTAISQPDLGTFPGLAALLQVLGSVFLLSQPADGVAGRLLCSKPLVWIGALSYSFYLWHWHVLAFRRYYGGQRCWMQLLPLYLWFAHSACLCSPFTPQSRPLEDKKSAKGELWAVAC